VTAEVNDTDGARARPASPSEVDDAVALGSVLKRIRRAPWLRLLEGVVPTGEQPPLELGEIDTLDEIAVNRGATMSEIADGLQVTRSSATRAVERLEKRGLAQRYRDADSRRAVRVRLTPDGLTVYWELMDRQVSFILGVFRQLDPTEQSTMTEVLPRVVDLTLQELDAAGGSDSDNGDQGSARA
jgi:DNA-binding MarR family transcriptional regulator